jgi:hypothetical protein
MTTPSLVGHRVTRRLAAALIAAVTTTGTMLLAITPAGAAIVTTVPLGTAANYSILASSTVTNTGPSVINGGNVGVSPGTSITGFDPVPGDGINTAGVADIASVAGGIAQGAVSNAYTNARNRSPNQTLAVDLGNTPGNLPLPGGVYDSTSHGELGLTGQLVLDGGGNPNTVFIFQSGSTLITAAGSEVLLINGAQECNVFWQLDSSATLGANSVFVGNILADDAVSLGNGVVVNGRAFASNAAVTLINDVFNAPTCNLTTPTTAPGGGGGGGTATTVPGGGTATTVPGGGTATTLPGGGTGTTLPGTATPTLPGTPPGSPGVPPIAGPPRTGGTPLPGAGFPWFAALIAGLFGTAALGGTLRARRANARTATAPILSNSSGR